MVSGIAANRGGLSIPMDEAESQAALVPNLKWLSLKEGFGSFKGRSVVFELDNGRRPGKSGHCPFQNQPLGDEALPHLVPFHSRPSTFRTTGACHGDRRQRRRLSLGWDAPGRGF